MERERITTIVGEPGTGKSRLARLFMRDERRLILIDTMLEHDEFHQVDLYELRELVEDDEPFRVRVAPRNEKEIEWVCNLAAWRPHICVVVEEYNLHWTSAHEKPPVGLLNIVRAGRKLDQSAILITQSPTAIDKVFLEFGTVFTYRLRGLRARKYIRDFTENEVDPAHLTFEPGEFAELARIQHGVVDYWHFDFTDCSLMPLTPFDEDSNLHTDEERAAVAQGNKREGVVDEAGPEGYRSHHGRDVRDDGPRQDGEEGLPDARKDRLGHGKEKRPVEDKEESAA